MKYNFKQNWLTILSLLFLVALFTGCIAAVPIVVHYMKADEGYVATADINKDADEIWQTIIGMVEKREAEGSIKVLKKEDSDRMIEVTDEIQTAEVKVSSKEGGGSKIIVKADVPSESNEEKEEELKKEEELAIRIMNNICEEAKASCKLVEE